MSSETLEILKSILNSIHNPAYIKENNNIIAYNDFFNFKYLNKNYLQKNHFTIKESTLYNNLQLCEIISNDISKLAESNKKLIRALALL